MSHIYVHTTLKKLMKILIQKQSSLQKSTYPWKLFLFQKAKLKNKKVLLFCLQTIIYYLTVKNKQLV